MDRPTRAGSRTPAPTAADPSREARPWVRRWHGRLAVLGISLGGVVGTASLAAVLVLAAGGGVPPGVAQLLAGLASTGAALAGYVAVARLVERRRPVELAPAAAPRQLLLGAALGAGLFCTTIGVLSLTGTYQVVGRGTVDGALLVLGVALTSGFVEELVLRGGLFRIAEQLLGTWVALAISSVVFGAAHLSNPGASLVPAVAVALEAGLLLGAAYVVTRRLWVPIGLHTAWNASQGGIFGIPVSGADLGAGGLLEGRLSGPSWLSGGQFGAEASVVAVVVCLVPTVLLLLAAARTGQVRAPRWRRDPGPGPGRDVGLGSA